MKKVGKKGNKILAGQMTTGTRLRLNLWDGKFTTGYRITKVAIAPDFPSSGEEFVGKLTTVNSGGFGDWDFGNVEELAWFTWGVPLPSRYSQSSLIRGDNMVIEDLYLNIYTTAETGLVNYYIEFEKYEFTAWDGAGTMVRNQGQAGPPE